MSFLKKAVQSSLKKTEPRVKFINASRSLVESIQRGCELINLSRRSYYYEAKERWPGEVLEARISDICQGFSGYGYRWVTKQLQREGWIINHKKVARIMWEKGWSCHPRKRKWVTTTNSDHGFRISMSRKGNPYDNVYAESFIKTLKSK